MNMTDITWTDSAVTIVINGPMPIIIRMTNDEAEGLYNTLSLRASSPEKYNKDGEFDVNGRVYRLTAGQWASVYRTLEEWYADHFEANYADDLFGHATPVSLRAVK